MKLEEQVISLDLARRLKELGVQQKSLFYWRFDASIPNRYISLIAKQELGGQPPFLDFASAFTVAELGEMLPFAYTTYKSELCHYVAHSNKSLEIEKANTEADARAKMLIHLIESKIVKVEELK